jgi:hypothetical protein
LGAPAAAPICFAAACSPLAARAALPAPAAQPPTLTAP